MGRLWGNLQLLHAHMTGAASCGLDPVYTILQTAIPTKQESLPGREDPGRVQVSGCLGVLLEAVKSRGFPYSGTSSVLDYKELGLLMASDDTSDDGFEKLCRFWVPSSGH